MLELIWVATILAIGVVGGIITENKENEKRELARYRREWARKMHSTTLDCRFK